MFSINREETIRFIRHIYESDNFSINRVPTTLFAGYIDIQLRNNSDECYCYEYSEYDGDCNCYTKCRLDCRDHNTQLYRCSGNNAIFVYKYAQRTVHGLGSNYKRCIAWIR